MIAQNHQITLSICLRGLEGFSQKPWRRRRAYRFLRPRPCRRCLCRWSWQGCFQGWGVGQRTCNLKSKVNKNQNLMVQWYPLQGMPSQKACAIANHALKRIIYIVKIDLVIASQRAVVQTMRKSGVHKCGHYCIPIR